MNTSKAMRVADSMRCLINSQALNNSHNRNVVEAIVVLADEVRRLQNQLATCAIDATAALTEVRFDGQTVFGTYYCRPGEEP